MNTIEQTSGFSFDRFFNLCRRFIALNQRKWVIGFAGAIGLLIVVWLGTNIFNLPHQQSTLIVLSIGFLLYQLGGYALTSTLFSELNSVGSAPQMYTLPASNFEKLSASWFLSYVCYTVLVVSALYLLGVVIGFGSFLFNQPAGGPGISFLETDVFNKILTYTIYHSVFLLGAVYFHKFNFLKTALAIIVFFAALGIITVIFINFIAGVENSHQFFSQFQALEEYERSIRFLFTLMMTVLFLTFAYIRLKNRQVA